MGYTIVGYKASVNWYFTPNKDFDPDCLKYEQRKISDEVEKYCEKHGIGYIRFDTESLHFGECYPILFDKQKLIQIVREIYSLHGVLCETLIDVHDKLYFKVSNKVHFRTKAGKHPSKEYSDHFNLEISRIECALPG